MAGETTRLLLFMKQVRRAMKPGASKVLIRSAFEGCEFAREDILSIHDSISIAELCVTMGELNTIEQSLEARLGE